MPVIPIFRGLAGLVLILAGAGGWAADFPCVGKRPFLKLIALGDSRAPHHPNKARLLAAVKAEKPDVFLHLGDMVHDASPEAWQGFDQQEGKLLRQQRFPFLPVVGNHEMRRHSIWDDPLTPLFSRFPELAKTPWYDYRCGPLHLLVLQGNDRLVAGSRQRQWLEEKLQDADPDGFLVVAVHQPLLTGQPGYGHPQAEGVLMPLFQWARNHRGVDLVLSGHVHNYERFQRGRMHLVVSGGGGSPFYPLERLTEDHYQGRAPGLHYLRLTLGPRQLELAMIAAAATFAQDGSLEILDNLTIMR